jgi:hypothetical protein
MQKNASGTAPDPQKKAALQTPTDLSRDGVNTWRKMDTMRKVMFHMNSKVNHLFHGYRL